MGFQRAVLLQAFGFRRSVSLHPAGVRSATMLLAWRPLLLVLSLVCLALFPTGAQAQSASATSIASSVNPSTVGQSVTFTATVVDPGGRFTPTGSVTFTDTTTSTPLGTITLNGAGQASVSTSSLAGGNHTITADYSGDGNLAASSDSLVQQVLSGTATSTSISSSINPSTVGQSVTFTATVTGTSTPTGTVTFTDTTTSTPLGTVSLNGSGQASVSTASLAVGDHDIMAQYNGVSGTFDPSSATLTQHVQNKSASSTVLTSSQNPSVFGQSVTFTATVSDPGGHSTPTGNVTFMDGATTLGVVALNGSGQATVTTTSLSVGPHSIAANYGGDVTFDTSSDSLTQTVNQISTTTSLASSQNPSTFGQSVTFTATVAPVAPGTGTPTGNVTFTDTTTSTTLGTGTLNGSGQATLTTSALGVGSHSITAQYNGATNYATGTSSPLTQVVNPGATAVALGSSQNPSTFGQSVTFTATVTDSGTPTGTVTFKDGAATLGTGTLNGSGQATLTTSSLSVGSHTITAEYGGDSNHSASTSPPLTQVVNQSSTTVTLASSLNPSEFGQAVTFTATVSDSGGTPTGTVTFKDGATVLGTTALNGSALATFTTSSLTVGTHPITATYNGDGSFAASTSAVLVQSVAVPADSLKLRAMQIIGSKLVAQSSGNAISGAIDNAVTEGFEEGGPILAMAGNGVRFNFTADTQDTVRKRERIDDAFSALAYADGRRGIVKAPNAAPPRPPREWFAWADVRGTGWNTDPAKADITGGQVNALAGVTHKLTPNFLIGVLAGYENFDYRSETLNGRLKGDGWTAGAYLGWRLLPSVRFDLGIAHSDVSYDDQAGTATGSFPGHRWLVSSGLTGTYKPMKDFTVEPSARVFALWEHQKAYMDNLGTLQAERNFSTGRASAGARFSYVWHWSDTFRVIPYVGGYADYRFSSDDASTAGLLLPDVVIEGWSARAIAGIAFVQAGGARFSVGGELGGIGASDYKTWSVVGRASLPFF
jgi:Bacterial Ig-like domain (group 3)/Autotransporter beta-domain